MGYTTLESLPVEIRINIFSRLDAKTLTKFHCVSKPFSLFVSSPDLISTHRILSSQNPRLLFSFTKNESVSFCSVDINTNDIQFMEVLPFLVDDKYFVNTCLGLVCVHDNREDGRIYIFNPTNKQSFSLPPLDFSPYLAPPKYESIHLAFGCVTSINEYKVLRIGRILLEHTEAPDFIYITHIFTMGKDKCWRVVENPSEPCDGSPTLVNEDFYWLNNESFAISKFDLAKEEWCVLPVFPFALLNCPDPYLTELGGCLCLVGNDHETKHIDIWILQNFDTYSWSKEYHINLSSLIKPPVFYAWILKIDKDGRLLIFVFTNKGKFVYYDPNSRNVEDSCIRQKLGLGSSDHIREPTFYLDSFISLEDKS